MTTMNKNRDVIAEFVDPLVPVLLSISIVSSQKKTTSPASEINEFGRSINFEKIKWNRNA